jgi:hypothetical protein
LAGSLEFLSKRGLSPLSNILEKDYLESLKRTEASRLGC